MIWLMPSYFKEYRCKCDKCRNTCCSSWNIPISKNEYYRLLTMECTDELHNKIECSFKDPEIISDEKYKIISYNWLGNCPLQKDGLCMIHANTGEENLPLICRLYPRSYKQINDHLIACCSSSCEAIVELLYKADSINIIKDELDVKPQLKYEIEDEEYKLIMKFNEMLKDRSTSLLQSICEICLLINEKEFKNDFNNNTNPLTMALNILKRFKDNDNKLDEIIEELDNRYTGNYYQYEIDKARFEKTYPNWMNFFENVLNNSLIYENFPFVDNRFSDTLAYKGLCAAYGLLRLVCIGYTNIHEGEEYLIDAVTCLFRLIDHTAFYYNISIICDDPAILLKL